MLNKYEKLAFCYAMIGLAIFLFGSLIAVYLGICDTGERVFYGSTMLLLCFIGIACGLNVMIIECIKKGNKVVRECKK